MLVTVRDFDRLSVSIRRSLFSQGEIVLETSLERLAELDLRIFYEQKIYKYNFSQKNPSNLLFAKD
jgi:hypothetical protein